MESQTQDQPSGSETVDAVDTTHTAGDIGEPQPKRVKMGNEPSEQVPTGRINGVATIKKEFLVSSSDVTAGKGDFDDDAAEARDAPDARNARDARDGNNVRGKKDRGKKQKGQNKERDFGSFSDSARLCNSRANVPEFSPRFCKFGDRCNALHDLRKYLEEGRRGDLTDKLGGKCPVFEAYGRCASGWRCRFVSSHMKEVEHEDGRKELVLVEDAGKVKTTPSADEDPDAKPGIANVVPIRYKFDLNKKRVKLEKSEEYLSWLEKDHTRFQKANNTQGEDGQYDLGDYRAQYIEPPFKPSEKRRIYFGRDTPVLAPLTTQGNLPFRRLCVELGCQATYSEMAHGLPIVQGQINDWALMKAHESELTPPVFTPGAGIVQGYDNSKDLKFGAQISANAPWVAVKATEALTRFCPHLRLVDLNCGCPIDMIFNTGAGSALMDSPAKLERIIRSMNYVSNDVPITAKIRMGVKETKFTAHKLVDRLAFGSHELRDWLGAPGCAAITLHGRTRQQRYTKVADWSYIAECAALVKSYRDKKDELTDTVREPDQSSLPNGGSMYFLGNGDCFSHADYYDHLDNAGVDSVMIGRAAIIKPWIFEEIQQGQYLDKSATERLGYLEKFVRYGLETWGSDEMGINFTRRFLLEFLSFYWRYIPVGMLEYMPPRINDRPPEWRGRNELEVLLASNNYKDWMKISEMFLGPAHPDFKYQPKHKSNSYEIEAEG